jgi:uncharacterized membrane protein YkoI
MNTSFPECKMNLITANLPYKFRKGDKPMKINRFFVLAIIALLVVAAMGIISAKALARTESAPAAQTQNCDQQDNDPAEVQNAPDTDNVEEQCGDQNAPDGQASANDVDTDTTEVQAGDQNGPDTAEAQGVEEANSADGQEAAPNGTPAISAEQAKAFAIAAHPGTVIQVELDDENGQLVYSVEFEGGVVVKVDAMTGVVLGTESGQD